MTLMMSRAPGCRPLGVQGNAAIWRGKTLWDIMPSRGTRIRVHIMDITVDAVIGMAPDDASVRAARGLVAPGKWPALGFDDAAVWGACQGSGSKPYQVRIDLSAPTGPVCSCSCPSRKIPCKHALALLLLRVQHPTAFSATERPEWVEEWLQARRQRAAGQEEKKERRKEQARANPAAAARREAARLARVRDGLDELERWMCDQTQHGFSSLSGQHGVWDKLAARMVDAQAPGMAARLRALNGIAERNPDWPAALLGHLGTIQLLIDAFRHMDDLSPSEQADVRAALGLAPDRSAQDGAAPTGTEPDLVEDVWLTLGVTYAEEDRLWRRRVWLRGQTCGRLALLLDFSHGGRQFETVFSPGDRVRMTLDFYPGSAPLRARVLAEGRAETAEPPQSAKSGASGADGAPGMKDGQGTGAEKAILPSLTLDDALMDMARVLAANPWRLPLPLVFNGARICRRGEVWLLLADGDRVLPLDIADAEAWEILARSGGHPFLVCGEWDGVRLRIAGALVPPEA